MKKTPNIEKAMRLGVFEKLDKTVADALSAVTLVDLVTETERHREENTFMFYV